MSGPPEDIEILIALLARLPGLGPRSARRLVLYLVKNRGAILVPLAKAITAVSVSARECVNCGNIAGDDLCSICQDPARANGQICVVEDVADLWAMERVRAFKGRYHVLGGTLSALDDIAPEDLGIPRLRDRVTREQVEEVILALGATLDGQTTAHCIAAELSGVRVTSLARGVPMGGELDYLDDGTITAALDARQNF